MLSLSRERFDQNLISQCENWSRAFVPISALETLAPGGVWFGGGALVTDGLLIRRPSEAEALRPVHSC